jgi:hypothetical protein
MDNKTAVEWLIEKCACADLRPELWEIIKQQAKEMEKEQIMDAYKADMYPIGDDEAEQYYNETYGGKE